MVWGFRCIVSSMWKHFTEAFSRKTGIFQKQEHCGSSSYFTKIVWRNFTLQSEWFGKHTRKPSNFPVKLHLTEPVQINKLKSGPIIISTCTSLCLCLYIGCPVVSAHKMPVYWDYNNHTLEEASGGSHYRMLVGGHVLEVNTLHVKFSGQYRCQTLINTTRQILSAWINVHTEGELYLYLHLLYTVHFINLWGYHADIFICTTFIY